MKRSFCALGLFFSAAFAIGCPMYSDNGYYPPPECFYATDCPVGYHCAPGGVCVLSPPHGGTGGSGGGSDGGGDASTADAPPMDGPTDGSLPEGSSDGAPLDGGPLTWCGNPRDCASDETCSTDGACHSGNCAVHPCINQYTCSTTPNGSACLRANNKGCAADGQCFVNERCIDGSCTALDDLCTDRAQCGAAKACADGRCVATCTNDGSCLPGFVCNTVIGVCAADQARACLRTSDCGRQDQVCVDGACVSRCTVGGACGAGAGVCVDNGCIPSTKPVVECAGQGTSAGCPAGSVCLQRHCYVACGQDGGGCNAQSSAPVCKSVTISNASYAVCGTTETLGSECDPTVPKLCSASKICIDGYCR